MAFPYSFRLLEERWEGFVGRDGPQDSTDFWAETGEFVVVRIVRVEFKPILSFQISAQTLSSSGLT